MSESGNIFENFIASFYVKFGKLQIRGFHGKGGLPDFNSNRTVSPGKQRMMSNMKGAEHGAYGHQIKSRVVRNNAYGVPQQNDVLRASSHLSTENFNSNQALPAVNEY